MKRSIIKGSLLLTLILLMTTGSCGVKDKESPISDSGIKIIKINEQEWMAENLDVAVFRNGDSIPEAKTDAEWEKAGKEGNPAWCINSDSEGIGKHGKLYNWHAVIDPRGLAPEGWHIPTDTEWKELADFLGGGEVTGSKLKSTEGWARDGNGTNETDFSGGPGGSRAGNGAFNDSGAGTIGGWWSSTETYTDYAWIRYMTNLDGRVYKDYFYKDFGFSVRCIKDE